MGVSFDDISLLLDKGSVDSALVLIREYGVNTPIDTVDDTILHLAACRGDESMVRFCLDNGANVDAQGLHGMTALMIAVACNDLPLIKMLLDANADVNVVGDGGCTALSFCCGKSFEGIFLPEQVVNISIPWPNPGLSGFVDHPCSNCDTHVEIAKLLTDAGASIDAEVCFALFGSPDVSILGLAISKNHYDVAKFLIELGADVNQMDGVGYPPLTCAVRTGDIRLVRLLLDAGARPNVRNMHNETPLMNSSYRRFDEITALLSSMSEDPNEDPEALISAAKSGDLGLLRSLVDHGAALEARDKADNTALIWAAANGQAAAVSLLLSHGADASAVDANGTSALVEILTNYNVAEHTRTSIVVDLCEHGADVNAEDRLGRYPLMCAINSGNASSAEYLCSKGANLSNGIHYTYSEHNEPVNYIEGLAVWAMENDLPDVLKELITYCRQGVHSNFGYDDSPQNRVAFAAGTNFLTLAAGIDEWRAIVVLVNAGGMDVDMKNDFGLTPLMVAANNKCWRAYRILKDLGANSRLIVPDTMMLTVEQFALMMKSM